MHKILLFKQPITIRIYNFVVKMFMFIYRWKYMLINSKGKFLCKKNYFYLKKMISFKQKKEILRKKEKRKKTNE